MSYGDKREAKLDQVKLQLAFALCFGCCRAVAIAAAAAAPYLDIMTKVPPVVSSFTFPLFLLLLLFCFFFCLFSHFSPAAWNISEVIESSLQTMRLAQVPLSRQSGLSNMVDLYCAGWYS